MARPKPNKPKSTFGSTQRNISKLDKFKHYTVQRALQEGHSKAEIMKIFRVNERNIVMAQEKIKNRANKKPRKEKAVRTTKKRFSKTIRMLTNQEKFNSLKKSGLIRGTTKSGIIVPTKECVRIIDERLTVLNQKGSKLRKMALGYDNSAKRVEAGEELRIVQSEISALAPAVQGRLSKSNLPEFFSAIQKLSKI